jgi:hypothetical protein
MKVLKATFLLLIVSAILVTPVPSAAEPSGVVPSEETGLFQRAANGRLNPGVTGAQPQTDATTSAMLPFVAKERPRCSEDSPFGIQIAALHQVTQSQPSSAISQAEAEWLARYNEEFSTLVQALEASGACWARVRVDWALIQPNPPPTDYKWGPYHDDKLRQVAEAGVQLIAHLDSVPEWAGDLAYGPIHRDRLDDFAQFLSDLVNRYKQPPYNIRHWELFNEPDRTFLEDYRGGWGLNAERYAEMLALAYGTIKAADPGATVLMGGVAHDWFLEYGGPFYRYFPDEVMIAAGAGNPVPWDVSNLHYFPDFHKEWERWDPNSEDRLNGWLPAPTCGDLFDGAGLTYDAGGIDLVAKVSHFRNRMNTCFGLNSPIWVTELGEHGYPEDSASLTQQARYVVQGYARGLAAGAQNIVWFVLVSPPYDYHAQGLLYQDDWSPKPAFHAYQTLTTELQSHTFTHALDVPNVEGYVFHDAAHREKTVAWAKAEADGATAPLSFAPASRLRTVDLLGSVTFVDDGGAGDADGVRNGVVQLQMTADPVFVSR